MSNEKPKVILIIDSSEAFLSTKVKEIYKSWGFTRETVTEKTQWQFVSSAPSLFGEVLMTHLDLTDKKNLKEFADFISERKNLEAFKGDWYGNGVIITATSPQGTKKIEKLVISSGGTVLKKEKSEKRKSEMFAQLKLNNEVKEAVDSYVGEDYDLMLSFFNEVNELPADQQRSITVERAFSYFPPIPGSVPPWNYLNELLNGHTNEAISLFERTIINTHILVTLVFLTKKMSLLYRVKMAQVDGARSANEVSNSIGERNGPEIWSITKVAQRVTPENAERIAKIVVKLESDLKGGSGVDPNTSFKVALSKIGLLLGNRN